MPRTREIIAAQNAVKKAIKKYRQMKEKYPKKLEKELKFIGLSIITDWYSSYEPLVYERQEDLLNAYKINVDYDTGKFNVDFGAEFMEHSHHQSNEYVFERTFVEGYHGGAYGIGLPHIPFWRQPVPYFNEWYRSAYRSPSPHRRMVIQMNKKIKEIKKEVDQDIDIIVDYFNVKLFR